MTLRFGTDGVRGVANVELTPELVTALGRPRRGCSARSRSWWAATPGASGPMLEAALSPGSAPRARPVASLGVVPTPQWRGHPRF